MVYHVIGTMSGSSLDGLDLAYCVLEEIGGKWSFQIQAAECIPFNPGWQQTLGSLDTLPARELLRTHTAFGHWMGQEIAAFIDRHALHHKIHLISSHGHTAFHEPALGMTFQLGDGASMAAETGLPVVSDLRNLDVALGGQGAPIVPIGEKYLWPNIPAFLNLGGIANLTIHKQSEYLAYDVCPANRILNLLAAEAGMTFDDGGQLARRGQLLPGLLNQLNALDYYHQQPPKSLSNEFGLYTVWPLIAQEAASLEDKLHTYVEHMAQQVGEALHRHQLPAGELLLSGGGALNTYLAERLQHHLTPHSLQVRIPHETLVQYKEALVMALIGVLRWREEVNVLSSVTGARRSSVGGALWMGQD